MAPISNGPDFVAALAATGKFSRNAKSVVLFEVAPADWVAVSSKATLTALLAEVGDIQIDHAQLTCDPAAAWHWLQSYKWKLPRTGGRPTVRQS